MYQSIKIKPIAFLIWGIAATYFLYEFFLRTFVGSIAHQLIHDLQLNIEEFTYIGSAYYLAYGIMQMPVGILADRFGVKKIMVLGTLSCALSTFLFSHSANLYEALLGRFFMGFGSSFAFVCLLIVVSNWFPKRYFAFFAGASQFIGTMGPVLAGGPLISWLVSTHISWRVALSHIAIFGIILAALTALFVKNNPANETNELIFIEDKDPILTRIKRLLSTKQAWAVAIYSASIYIPLAAMAAVWGTDYLQAIGLSQQSAAYMISISWIAYALGCLGFGFLSDYMKRRKPILILCGILGLLSTFLIIYVKFKSLLVYQSLFFIFGLAATGQNIGFAAITEHSSSDTKASALGFNNGLIILSGAALPVIIGFIVSLSSHAVSAQHIPTSAFVYGLSLLPILYALALFISLFAFKETYCKPQKDITFLSI